MESPFPTSPPTSILSAVIQGERNPAPSILELAYREPHPSGQPWHVVEAHARAVEGMNKPRQSVTAEITFSDTLGAFELVPENRDCVNILRALGPGAKITIHY